MAGEQLTHRRTSTPADDPRSPRNARRYDHVVFQPQYAGQLILDEVAVRLRPLLARSDFVKFCDQRNLRISAELMQRFEELRLFAPIIRITRPPGDPRILYLDGHPTAADFAAGWVVDCSAPDAEYPVPPIDDRLTMPFYSAFQVWALEWVLRETTMTFTLDEVAGSSDVVDWSDRFRGLRSRALEHAERLRSNIELTAVPILCQLISNRYLPHALSNQRTYQVGGVSLFGGWMAFNSGSWDWHDYCDKWDPTERVACFALDEQSLERAHWRMVSAMYRCDPLWRWRNLIQFVNQRKRDELRGDALRAELYRQCAEMLRFLYRDLYRTDLGPPEDALHGMPCRIPEPAVRDDPREYLQFVANQYDLNPQPKAVLFVEGQSEVVFTQAIFGGLFGLHHGVSGVEVVNLHGVGNATGSKRFDRYNAIFRLVDYLLEHQTLVFLVLDNEGQATRLRQAAASKPSVFGNRQRAIAPDRIHLWDQTFELDNFEDEELARAMTIVAGERVQFAVEEIQEVRSHWPGATLSEYFERRADRVLTKPELARVLAELIIQSPTRSDGTERPIVEFLRRVRREASRNPLPLTQDIWRQNQEFLDAEGTTESAS